MTSVVAIPVWAGNGTGGGITALSDEEITHLNYMREEEKLARDVYLFMYGKWNAVIFTQVADSEQQHMDTMKKMLDKYNLPDPASTEIGDFNNLDLQAKYDELIAAGSDSYVDGLYVGATIEEIDMIDIQEAIDFCDHVDLLTAYQHLLEGSKNHLRAYVGTLEKQGFTYEPQFISQELFDAIMGLL
jgi:hypothetical protein